jgi:hypothetical protein
MDSEDYVSVVFFLLLVLVLIIICFVSPNSNVEENPYPVVVIEKCEYLKVSEDNLVHKGNCSNPIHPNVLEKE